MAVQLDVDVAERVAVDALEEGYKTKALLSDGSIPFGGTNKNGTQTQTQAPTTSEKKGGWERKLLKDKDLWKIPSKADEIKGK